jgi:hypothetical protein
VTETVVDDLEIVQVDEQHGERSTIRSGAQTVVVGSTLAATCSCGSMGSERSTSAVPNAVLTVAALATGMLAPNRPSSVKQQRIARAWCIEVVPLFRCGVV